MIDTINGKEQLLQHERIPIMIEGGRNCKSRLVGEKKVVVMTYAKFGVLAERYPILVLTFVILYR